MARGAVVAIAVVLTASGAGYLQAGATTPPKVSSPRLYVFDCGVIKGLGVELFGFKKDEVPIRDFFVACYLVAHPKGTLMWDVGVIPDSAFKSDGAPVTEGASTVSKPLLPQLAALGYTPADITYLAMSHYHSDHTANANAFAGSTWLVRAAERDAMFAEKPAGIIQQDDFLRPFDAGYDIAPRSRVDLGAAAPAPAPLLTIAEARVDAGHQVLFLKLENRPLLVAGDFITIPKSGR
jgi:glyoxylase-like metal-dependent hydrolase (beta-lactamase superfamily II)